MVESARKNIDRPQWLGGYPPGNDHISHHRKRKLIIDSKVEFPGAQWEAFLSLLDDDRSDSEDRDDGDGCIVIVSFQLLGRTWVHVLTYCCDCIFCAATVLHRQLMCMLYIYATCGTVVFF